MEDLVGPVPSQSGWLVLAAQLGPCRCLHFRLNLFTFIYSFYLNPCHHLSCVLRVLYEALHKDSVLQVLIMRVYDERAPPIDISSPPKWVRPYTRRDGPSFRAYLTMDESRRTTLGSNSRHKSKNPPAILRYSLITM